MAKKIDIKTAETANLGELTSDIDNVAEQHVDGNLNSERLPEFSEGVDQQPFGSNETDGKLHIDPSIRKVSNWQGETPEVKDARRSALRSVIKTEASKRTVYYWFENGAILDGCDFFEVAEELGLLAGADYLTEAVPCANLDAALRWRWERNISARKQIPTHIRCLQVVELYRDELKRQRQQTRQNRAAALKGQRTAKTERIDSTQFLADKASVSLATMKRMLRVYRELKLDPNDPNPKKRAVLKAETLDHILGGLDNHDKCIKQASEDIKNKHERLTKGEKNSGLAPAASDDFVCDTDFDPSKSSQIICGDSLELLKRWASLPKDQRPTIKCIFGSPPYWIPRGKSSQGKGRILYGNNVQALWERLDVKTFEDYVEKFLRPYIEYAYELLPEGGALAIQVDNTRGRDENHNLMVFWHTDAIRRIGQSLGFIPCSEIIWSKDEISGRRQGFGSPNTRSVRPNHEYIIVMRKDCNRIEGDFGEDDGECYDYCVSCWDDKQLAELSNGERSKFLTNVWDIETARDNPHREFPHPATFPVTLAYGVVKLFVPEDGVIIDPWNGIGTTCAAALLANRRFIGIDIEPYFCEEATAKVERTIKELPRLREKLQQRLNKRLLNALNIAPTSSTAS